MTLNSTKCGRFFTADIMFSSGTMHVNPVFVCGKSWILYADVIRDEMVAGSKTKEEMFRLSRKFRNAFRYCA